jgi:hypothetical protein
MQQMAENVMVARTVQGIGGAGSDMMRRQLMNLVPDATTPSKEYGEKQLDAFQRTFNQLKTGIPTTGGRQTAPVGAGRGAGLQTPTAGGSPPAGVPHNVVVNGVVVGVTTDGGKTMTPVKQPAAQ